MSSQPTTPAECSFLKEGVVLWSSPFAPHSSTSFLLFRLQFLQPSSGCPFLHMSLFFFFLKIKKYIFSKIRLVVFNFF